jgi:MFS family permease
MTGVLLGIYLAKLRIDPGRIGFIVGAGLAGGAAASLLVTLAGDRMGRRRTLVALAILGGAGALAAACASSAALLGGAAFFGMLNGMGRDRGAAMILDQAILPSTTSDEGRTRAFAWYNVVQDLGHALGALLAALPEALRALAGIEEAVSLRASVGLAGGLTLLSGGICLLLSPAVEAAPVARRAAVTPATRRILVRISILFALDSLGGGFLTAALLSYFFFERFGAEEGTIGLLFLAARSLNAISHLAAARLARRFGLVNTMVFTHIPSSLLLATVPVAPSFAVAAALFLLREGLVEMDVPTRQSYVMAVVRPEERTAASGVTHQVRMGGWAAAPFAAGPLMAGVSLGTPLVVGAAMKIAYDLILYASFRNVRPPEEIRVSGAAAARPDRTGGATRPLRSPGRPRRGG